MNGYERIKAAIDGRAPDRVPVMLHNFMMAAREHGATMREFRSSGRTVADCFIAAVEKYGYDGILIDIDTVTLAGAVGVPVDFPEDEPARPGGVLLPELSGVMELEPVDIGEYLGVRVLLEAVSLLREHFGDEIMIRGNADQCPFSLASMIRGAENWMMDLMDEEHHDLVFRLLDYCLDVTTRLINLIAAAGAHMTSNGDSPAGPEMISPAMYARFALPYEQKVAAHAHRLGLPYVLHICGNTSAILDSMVQTGADGLELDQKTDTSLARRILEDRTAFFGNIDPSGVLALGTPELVERKTRELIELFAGNPRFVLNAGCAIPAETPSENLKAMIRAARSA
jgi:uroporphyrinogen decarboxylase